MLESYPIVHKNGNIDVKSNLAFEWALKAISLACWPCWIYGEVHKNLYWRSVDGKVCQRKLWHGSIARPRRKFLWEMQTVGSWQIVWRLGLALYIQPSLCCSYCSCTVHPRLWSFNCGSTKRSPGFLVLIFCFADCAARTLSNGLWNGWVSVSSIGSQEMKSCSAPICFSNGVLPRRIPRPWDGCRL